MKKVTKKIKMIGMAFLLFMLYVFLSIFMDLTFDICFKSTNYWISNVCLILANLFVLLAISLPFIPRLIEDFKKMTKKNVKTAYKNWFIGLVIMYVSNILIISFTKNIASNESVNREILYSSTIYAVFAMVIIAPLIEEIIFRLSIKNIFNNKWVYAAFSGLVFGLMHMVTVKTPIELLYVIPYGALGFFFAKSVYETDNIWSSMIAHMTHNGLIISILLLSKYLGV